MKLLKFNAKRSPVPTPRRVNRRAFLRGAGSIAIGLPFLEGLPERSAWAQSENPVFAFFICTACGVVLDGGDTFFPSQAGALTSEGMASSDRSTGALADYADRLLILRGISFPGRLSGCGHAQGLAQVLTGRAAQGGDKNATSTGMSADVFISNSVNGGAEGLNLYAGLKEGYINEKLSFRGAGQVRSAESNPYQIYRDLIGQVTPGGGGAPATPAMTDELLLRRKSANDLVREELSSLLGHSSLSQADRQRLDLHLSSVRQIELGAVEMAMSCSDNSLDVAAMEALNSGQAFRQNGKLEEVTRLHMDLVAFAFACNLNRVATLQSGDGTEGNVYDVPSNAGLRWRFHHLSHRVQSDGASGNNPTARQAHIEIDRLRMETFKHLLDRMASYSTNAGTLLDNSFAYWTNHVAEGPTHSFNNVPVIIAGSAGGYLKQGVFLNAQSTNDRVLNTVVAATGASGGDFGASRGVIDDMIA